MFGWFVWSIIWPKKKIKLAVDALLLSAGLGTRLRPFTEYWPKCLMPISGRPLIDYWLINLKACGFTRVFVNTHWHHNVVENYLLSEDFGLEIVLMYEPVLLGTAGTIRSLDKFRERDEILLAHADNFCDIDLIGLNRFHNCHSASISMVTFETDNPHDCGIVVQDKSNTVIEFHEKVSNPPSNLANAAVYVIDPLVIDYVNINPSINDFSTQVIPNFISDIKAFKHSGILIDIGSLDKLKSAQLVDMTNLKNIVAPSEKRPIVIPEYVKIERELLGN